MPDGSTQHVNITEKTDSEIRLVADALWRDLLKHSNEGNYGEFVGKFARPFALAMNEVAVNHQFANSELARSLAPDADFLGIIRRGEHVTVLYRQRSTKKPGEWLGRLVLGYEATADGIAADDVVTDVLAAVPSPGAGLRGAP